MYQWNHSNYRSGIHFVCTIYNSGNASFVKNIKMVSVSAILYSLLK